MGNYGCNSFINLFFDQTYIELFEKDCFYALDGLFDVYHQKIYKYKLCPNSEEIRKYFFEKIENGYCITCHWDEFYVSDSYNYKLNHTDKECLIYGFDSQNQSFYVLGINNCNISFYKVTSPEFFMSLVCVNKDEYSFRFTRYEPKAADNLNLYSKKIRDDIVDYLTSSCRYLSFPNSTQKFGIEALLQFCNYLSTIIHEHLLFDIDNIFVILDHKKLFFHRLVVLEKHGLITNERWADKYAKVLKMAREFKEYCTIYLKELNSGEKNASFERYKHVNELIHTEENLLHELVNRGFKQ